MVYGKRPMGEISLMVVVMFSDEPGFELDL